MNLNTCKNCGHTFTGKYCNECGEKVYQEHDKALRHAFEEVFHFVTHFDNKFFKTIWLVFKKPGFVSHEICNGVRKKYYKPVSLFLVGVILYLIFPSLRGLNITLNDHLENLREMHILFPVNWAKAKMAHEHINYVKLQEYFDEISPKVAKLLLFVILPLTGLLLKMLFRKQRKFYFDHFTLAAEINTFYLYFTYLLLPLVIKVVFLVIQIFGGGDLYGGDILFVALHFAILLVYSTVSFRRFYELKTGKAFLKSLLFLLGHTFIVYFLYRLILFCVVMLLV